MIPMVLLAAVVAGPERVAPEPAKPSPRASTLAAVEKELGRLAAQARQEPGPAWPRPSEEVSFLLLAGLAAQGDPVREPAAGERREFGLDRAGAETRLVSVSRDARLVGAVTWVQDKSGSYRRHVWTLYRHQDGKWVERGRGAMVGE